MLLIVGFFNVLVVGDLPCNSLRAAAPTYVTVNAWLLPSDCSTAAFHCQVYGSCKCGSKTKMPNNGGVTVPTGVGPSLVPSNGYAAPAVIQVAAVVHTDLEVWFGADEMNAPPFAFPVS